MSKPYLETWLRRTRKQLSTSGRLSELVLMLAADGLSTQEDWRMKLQRVIDGEEEPDVELLTRIDSLLARPASEAGGDDFQADLFM